MSGLHPVDLLVVILYLVGVTFAGIWSGRFIKNMGDFFMPRRFGKALMITHAFGTGTASDQAVVVAAQTFSHGVSGIWWQWLWLPITPFYWLIAPIMRRLRAVTTADVYELRFDRSVAVLFAIVGIVGLSVKIGLMLEGASALIHSSSGGMINSNLAVMVVTAMFVTYGMAGGLSAAIITDFFQGLLTVVFSFLLLPFVLHDVGGLSGVRETIRDPKMLSLTVPGVIGPFFIIMFALQALIGIVAQPFIMGVCSAGRTEMDGRVGFMFGNIVKRICTIAWSLTGIAAVAWYMQNNVDTTQMEPDHVYGNIAREFFPSLGPGLLGLFVASLLAAVMNSCDSYMIASSGLFTKNIYRPVVPDKTEKHYVAVGRLASLFVVIGGIVFAYYVPNVKTALEIWFRVAPPLGIAFWLGLLWRRTTPLGAWAATIAGFGVWWLTTRPEFIAALGGTAFAERFDVIVQAAGKDPAISQPWSILMYTSTALLSGVFVSLITPRVATERLQRFYDLTRTPVQEGEIVEKPCTLPLGVTPPPRRMLLTAFGLEVPMPSATSVVGFVVGCAAASLLVVGYMWLIVW
ncbi:MAG TPA: sodium:solute symporter family protein [Lacipirellulaceae bacterium]|jgi:Na+/proline symporter|nr:sodium:solute symporter family protein [Lacipirellulaceae bacterium]